MTTAQGRADAQDRHAPDHLPTCPSCLELLDVGARWCSDCGTWLHHDGPTSALMRARALDAARARGLSSRARMGSHSANSTPPAGEVVSPAIGTGS